MSSTADQHHHRNTTKVCHKPFKPRYTSKNALKDRSKGKIERLERGSRKTPHQQIMSKLDRRNQAKQKRLFTHQDHTKTTSVFSARYGAPRIVAIVPLCEDVATDAVIQILNKSMDIDQELLTEGRCCVTIDRFKHKVAYVPAKRAVIAAMDACRIADYVVFVLSPEQEVDQLGETIIRAVEGQGVSNVYTVVQSLDTVEPPKRRSQVLSSLKSFITHFFPSQEKVFSLDLRQDCQNMVRSLCTTTPKGVRWREERSWMLVEDVRWPLGGSEVQVDSNQQHTGEIVLTGVVRGRNLKADRLAQVGDWGSFQISKIVAAPTEHSRKFKENVMVLDDQTPESVLDHPTGDQDNLDELAPEEAIMEDVDNLAPSVAASDRKGVLLDDHHYFSGDENENVAELPKRLPMGTSKYQAAWYLGDISDSESDLEDVEDGEGDMIMNDAVVPADGIEGVAQKPIVEPTETGQSEYPQSEIFLDPSPDREADELAEYRANKKNEAEDDVRFPDEIELPPNVLARERLTRYRGLKSLRTSRWDNDEDRPYQPEDWSRLLEISDYISATSKVGREALVGGVKPGTRVHIYLRNVPLSIQQQYNPSEALALFSLLRHEHKRTALNFTITLNSDHPNPIRSKEELIMQCGPRRFIINPLFSQSGNTPNNVHKFERYLHPGRTATASFTAPLTWGAVPALFFKRSPNPPPTSEMDTSTSPPSSQSLTLIGHGTALPTSTSRIIAKRIVLTGAAYKIHRKLVTVRYMFFNTEDVAWFKALQLWTNHGRQGTIKESLGTHGYFKAVFDGKVGMQDAIGVSLYKRVWPRRARVVRVGDGV